MVCPKYADCNMAICTACTTKVIGGEGRGNRRTRGKIVEDVTKPWSACYTCESNLRMANVSDLYCTDGKYARSKYDEDSIIKSCMNCNTPLGTRHGEKLVR